MGVTTDKKNKPFNPRGNDQSPKGYNRAALYSGKALDFDGVNDNIIVNGIDSVFDYGNAYTMAGYFKIVDADSGSLMGNSSGNSFTNFKGFIYKNNADSNFYPDGSSSNFVTIYSGNTTDFVHIVCTSDGTTAKAYLNGQLVGSTSVSSYTNTGSRFNVGSSYSGNFGEIESAGVKVYSTALTAAQVADLYNNPEKVVPTGVDNTALKLWLPMMEGAGTTAYDGSGNGNHGTISGATYVNGIGAPVAQTAVMDWNKGSNILYYSEDFSNAAWIKSASAVLTPNTTIAPNGLQTADTLTLSGSGYIGRVLTTNATATFSVFAKYSDTPWLFIEGYDGADKGAWFNIQTGTLGSTNGGATAAIEEAANGFYRCSITAAIAGSTTYAIFQTTGNGSFTRATGDVIIWGAQLEESATLGAYIPNPTGSELTTPVLLPQGLTTGRDITGVNLFENVRKQGALNLDGNSWAEVHDNASLDVTTAVSVEAWVYWDGTSTDDGILGKWGDTSSDRCYMLYVSTSTEVRIFINSESILYNSMTTGWHHIVGTYDKAELKLFINGVRESISTSFTGDIQTSDKPIEIGQYRYGLGTRKHTNQIAQPRIYNRALTAEEVQRNYNAGKNIYTNS
jgi:hypothetical protein